MTLENDKRLAVLIDADNVSHHNLRGIMEEIARYGTPTYKRIYGDWTRPHLSGWKGMLLEFAITPIQQYGYTTGKNSTDSAMIIDAMDILYSGNVDGFCIVSSDSDFTRLAIRLRESGMRVIGIGEKKTPTPFITACEKFIYTDILTGSSRGGDSSRSEETAGEGRTESAIETAAGSTGAGHAVPAKSAGREGGKSAQETKQAQAASKRSMRTIVSLIAASIDAVSDDSGWAYLGEVGALILKTRPDFDPRNYGFSKLAQLIRSLNQFEVENRENPDGQMNGKLVFVRNKKG